jgi:hypothetical protein
MGNCPIAHPWLSHCYLVLVIVEKNVGLETESMSSYNRPSTRFKQTTHPLSFSSTLGSVSTLLKKLMRNCEMVIFEEFAAFLSDTGVA